jgi:predicted histone-like DNA-binding protein
MKYKLIERGKPNDASVPKKWYANPVNSGKVDQKAIAKVIAGRSSLTAGDIANVIQNFLEILPAYLTDGKSVQLGDFGTFRISFSSEGVDTQEAFNTNKINSKKVLFTPSPDFKRTLEEMVLEKE